MPLVSRDGLPALHRRLPEVDVKILATGLAAGVLLDAVVVRSLPVPATVSLLGHWNWWMPDPVRRLLRCRSSRRSSINPRR